MRDKQAIRPAPTHRALAPDSPLDGRQHSAGQPEAGPRCFRAVMIRLLAHGHSSGQS